MKLSKQGLNEWVDAYIKAQECEETIHENHPLFWAINQFFELEDDHPEICWEVILEVLHREPSQRVLGVLAAGPLEDLIDKHGPEYIEKIEKEAKVNPTFMHLLGGVWESGTPEVWNRVLKARRNISW